MSSVEPALRVSYELPGSQGDKGLPHPSVMTLHCGSVAFWLPLDAHRRHDGWHISGQGTTPGCCSVEACLGTRDLASASPTRTILATSALATPPIPPSCPFPSAFLMCFSLFPSCCSLSFSLHSAPVSLNLHGAHCSRRQGREEAWAVAGGPRGICGAPWPGSGALDSGWWRYGDLSLALGQMDRPGCSSLLLSPAWGIGSSPKCKEAGRRGWGKGEKNLPRPCRQGAGIPTSSLAGALCSGRDSLGRWFSHLGLSAAECFPYTQLTQSTHLQDPGREVEALSFP